MCVHFNIMFHKLCLLAHEVICSSVAIDHLCSHCIPRTKYVRGILWFSRRYATLSASAASAFHRLRDNLTKPYRIASIFYMYIDIGERIAGKQDWPGVIGSDVPWLECPACNALTWVITITE